LSLTVASEELRERASRREPSREPYRALLGEVRDRLLATRAWAESSLAQETPSAGDAQPYLRAAELLDPLALCFRSLQQTGNGLIASGRLTDVLRRVATFGITLARLDLRQEAARHREAVDWIARAQDLGRYADATEPARQQLLLHALSAPGLTLDRIPLSEAPDAVR